MKSAGALQVVIILLLVASAASCEVAKEYSTRVFKPTIPQKRIRFHCHCIKVYAI